MESSVELNKSIPLLALVEPAEMQELLPVLQPVKLEAGQVLFRENTPGEGMWILGDGTEVSISQSRGKRPVVIATNKAGETVGEMALIDGGPRSGAAVVTQAGRAFYISATDFRALREAYRPGAFKVMRQICHELCSRLRATSDRVAPSQVTAPPSQAQSAGRRPSEAEIDEFGPFITLPQVVKLALCQKLQSVDVAPGEAICLEGEQGEHAYFLISGEVQVTRNRQMREIRERVAADIGEHGRVVGADVEHLRALLRRERVETHSEHHQLAGATGGFEQAARIGVEARGRGRIDIADMGRVLVIRSRHAVANVRVSKGAVFHA